MSRRLTTYLRPSVRARLETAPDIERLAQLWAGINRAGRAGKLRAEKKTLDRWTVAVWNRVGALMGAAPTDGDLCFIYNVVLRWPKPAVVERELEALLKRRMAVLPNQAEREAAAGIELGGRTP